MRGDYLIIGNRKINKNNTYELQLSGNFKGVKPGQFINIKVPNKSLSYSSIIAYNNDHRLDIVYRINNLETKELANIKEGEKLSAVVGLGTGFNLNINTNHPLLIGEGTKVAPIYNLACFFKENGRNPKIIAGFESTDDLIYLDKFTKQHFMLYLAFKKDKVLVTDFLQMLNPNEYDYFYATGAIETLRDICNLAKSDGEVSIENNKILSKNKFK